MKRREDEKVKARWGGLVEELKRREDDQEVKRHLSYIYGEFNIFIFIYLFFFFAWRHHPKNLNDVGLTWLVVFGCY